MGCREQNSGATASPGRAPWQILVRVCVERETQELRPHMLANVRTLAALSKGAAQLDEAGDATPRQSKTSSDMRTESGKHPRREKTNTNRTLAAHRASCPKEKKQKEEDAVHRSRKHGQPGLLKNFETPRWDQARHVSTPPMTWHTATR